MIREHLCDLTRGELVTWGASGVDLHVKPDLAYPQITTPFWPKTPLYVHIYTYRSSSDQIRDPLWVISKSGLTLVSTPLAPLVTLLKNFLNVTIVANQVISTRLNEIVFLVALYQSAYIDLLRGDCSDCLSPSELHLRFTSSLKARPLYIGQVEPHRKLFDSFSHWHNIMFSRWLNIEQYEVF